MILLVETQEHTLAKKLSDINWIVDDENTMSDIKGKRALDKMEWWANGPIMLLIKVKATL